MEGFNPFDPLGILGRIKSDLDSRFGWGERSEDREWMTHLAIEEIHPGGLIVDEALARSTPCKCFQYNGKDYCFSPGVVGMLKQSEEAQYCPSKSYQEDGRKRRFEKFAAAAESAHKRVETIPRGERLSPWLSAMKEELGKSGIKI